MSVMDRIGLTRGLARSLPMLLVVVLAVAGGGYWLSQRSAQGAGASRSNDGEVMFVLTPRGVADGRFRVDIQVNTHSGDLGQLDLQAATELHVDGKTLHPLGPVALRGHHARGRLEFALDREPETFEIVIRGVRALGDLTFRWP